MKTNCCVIGLLLLLMAACAKKLVVPPPQEETLYQLEGCFPQKLDSIIQVLDTLNIEVLSEKERAHYCLLKVRTRDALFLYDSITDSLLKVAEDGFVGGKDKWFEALTCELLSRVAFKEGEGEQIKLEWLLKALQSIGQCQHIDERLIRFSAKPTTEQEKIDFQKYRLHYKLGMCYLNNHYNEESLDHLRKAGRYFEKTEHTVMRIQSANMLGNAYLANKLYDSCLLWYGKGLEVAKNHGKTLDIAYSHFSMSTYFVCRFGEHDYGSEEEGRQLLRQSVAECHQGLALYEGAMSDYKDCFYNDLSNAYFQLGQYDSCLYYSEKLLAYHKEHYPNIVPDNWVVDLYRHMYQSHEALGHTKETLEYARLYFEMQQAIEKQPKAVEQVKNEYDKKLEMIQLKNEQQAQRYRLYLLLALSLVALLVVLWLSNRYRKNKEIEILRQKEAYRKLETEFESASQQSLQALQQRVMELYKTKENDKLEHIIAEFEASYPLAKEKIKTNYPDLTESERNILILSFLGFRTKEEAEILHLSVNTVEKYRTNIRKKTGSNVVSQLIG
jgi:DNA-binding CsgD family transcriptional regulator